MYTLAMKEMEGTGVNSIDDRQPTYLTFKNTEDVVEKLDYYFVLKGSLKIADLLFDYN